MLSHMLLSLTVVNQVLREELRKVQSSAALLDRQRNPGVGYWSSSRPDGSHENLVSPSPASPPPTSSPRSSSPAPSGNDEDINLEYLRNVILQFLEHKEMRVRQEQSSESLILTSFQPNLVRVLSIILRFTPQETRRLIAKV